MHRGRVWKISSRLINKYTRDKLHMHARDEGSSDDINIQQRKNVSYKNFKFPRCGMGRQKVINFAKCSNLNGLCPLRWILFKYCKGYYPQNDQFIVVVTLKKIFTITIISHNYNATTQIIKKYAQYSQCTFYMQIYVGIASCGT